MNKGTLILICGLPGAGKTTLAKKLAIERNAIRLCPDDWIIAILKDLNDIPERDRLRDPVEQLLWQHAKRLLQLGMTVILENGFWSKTEREGYLATGKNLDARVELYFVDAPLEVLWERVEKRNTDHNEFRLTKTEIEDAFTSFEPPSDDEGKAYDYFSASF